MRRSESRIALARWQIRSFVSLGLSLALVCPALQAAPLYWDGTDSTVDADGGNGTWDDAALNWDTAATGGANSAWVANSIATFGGTAGSVNVSGAKSAEGMIFTTGGYSLAGDQITLVGGLDDLMVYQLPRIEFAGTANSTISNNIVLASTSASTTSGTNNIKNTGTGLLTISGNITRNGTTNQTVGFFGPGDTTVTGVLTLGSGQLLKSSNDAVSTDNNGTLTLANANVYTGATTIKGGTLRLANPNALGTTSGITLDDQGVGGSGAGATLENATGATFTLNRPVTLTSSNTAGGAAKFIGDGDFSFGNLVTSGTRGISIAAGRAVTFSSASSNTGSGAVLGKYGPGTLVITGTYTGAAPNLPTTVGTQSLGIFEGTMVLGGAGVNLATTTIHNGKLVLGNTTSLGTLAVSVLTLGGTGTTASSNYELTANTNLSGANAVQNPVTFGSTQAAPVLTISGSNPLQLGGTIALGTTANRQISTTNTATTTFSGVISGGPASGTAFTKLGAGVLELTADNTYIGNTVVNAGTLLINNLAGTATGMGTVTVNANGLIGGSGSIGGNLLGAGTLAPGNSIGTLTVGGSADLDGTWLIELDGAGGSDRLAVGSSLTLDAASDLLSLDHLTNGSLVGTYTLATFASLTGTFDAVTYEGSPIANPLLANSIGGTHNLVYNSNSIQLVPSVIPEPGTYALVALGSLLGLRVYRRRKVTAE